MEQIKGTQCHICLQVSQWGDILKCLKKYHTDTKAIVELETCLRGHVEQALDVYADIVREDIFGYSDPEAETQELPVIQEPVKLDPALAVIEEQHSTLNFGVVDYLFALWLSGCLAGFVTTLGFMIF